MILAHWQVTVWKADICLPAHCLQSGSASHQLLNGSASHVTTAISSKSTLPSLPPGKELPPGVTAVDAISRTLNTLPAAQLLDIIREMQQMAISEPQRAAELLTQAPQLTYAIFQAMLLMGLVSPEAINSVVEASPPPTSVSASNLPTNPSADLAENPEALMQAVMELPQETIDQLPEDERNQIMQLRATYQAAQQRV